MDFGAAIVVAVGSIVGVQAGAWAMPRVGDARLQLAFAILMIAVAVAMLVS